MEKPKNRSNSDQVQLSLFDWRTEDAVPDEPEINKKSPEHGRSCVNDKNNILRLKCLAELIWPKLKQRFRKERR